MATDVSSENEQFLRDEVANRNFPGRGESINAAVELLRQRRRLVDRLTESWRQLDQGECDPLDTQELGLLFDDLKVRAANRPEPTGDAS